MMFKKRVRVLLLGDYMLDSYTFGDVSRISPEAPVPVLKVKRKTFSPGGAGNVALNLLSLGASVSSVGRVGDDMDGRRLVEDLKRNGSWVDNMVVEDGYPTPVKNRLIAASQQLARVDLEEIGDLSSSLEDVVVDRLEKIIEGIDVVAISDYGKGFLTKRILRSLIEVARREGVPTLVDPKGRDFSKYRGASVIKPNMQEAYEASNLSRDHSLEEVSEVLLNRTDSDNLIITRSEDGITLFDRGFGRIDFPVLSKEVKDVTGAGDSVLAVLAVALGNGMDIRDAIELSNVAAGIAIEHVGCYRVKVSDIVSRAERVDKVF